MQSRGMIRWCNLSDSMVNMQITNSVVCDTSNGSLFKQMKLHRVIEHAALFAFRLTLQMLAAVG